MESNFAGLNDPIPQRKEREKRASSHRRKTFSRAIASVLVLIVAVAAGAIITEAIVFRDQHILARSIGSLGCGGLAAVLVIFFYTWRKSMDAVEKEIDGESDEEISGSLLWLLAMGIAWLAAPWGAYEGLWGELPRGLPILIGGYVGGLCSVVGIVLSKLSSRGMLG